MEEDSGTEEDSCAEVAGTGVGLGVVVGAGVEASDVGSGGGGDGVVDGSGVVSGGGVGDGTAGGGELSAGGAPMVKPTLHQGKLPAASAMMKLLDSPGQKPETSAWRILASVSPQPMEQSRTL